MDPTAYVRVKDYRRVSKRGKIEHIKKHDRLKPRPRPRL